MKQKIALTFQSVDVSLTISLNPTLDLNEAIGIVQAVFPGAVVEQLGSPLPGTLEAIKVMPSQQRDKLISERTKLSEYVLRSKAYRGLHIKDLLIDDLDCWLGLEGDTMDATDRDNVTRYLKLWRELEIKAEDNG